MLDQKIITELEKPLDAKRVKHRAGGGGMQLSYLKGYDVIDTANRIFGFGQWGIETLSNELQPVTDENGVTIGAYYSARIRLSVVNCMSITEEGACPVQEGRNPRAKIDAHDMARKGAITDAMKRAFRCFGDQFGNSLYDTDLVNGQPRDAARPGNAQPGSNNNNNRPPAAPAATSNYNKPAVPTNSINRPRPIPINSQAKAQAIPTQEAATVQQRNAIIKMADRRGVDRGSLDVELENLYGYGIGGLTRSDAAHFIKLFQEREKQQA